MNRECALIVNPVSGGYSAAAVARLISRLQEGGFQPELLPTRSPGDASVLAAGWCAGRPDPLVIAAGGDGTVNGVVNGLPPGRSTLAVIPLGTANVLAREIGISDSRQAVEKILAGATRPLTVGHLSGEAGERYFLLMAGIGFDGSVVATVRPGEKKLLKQGAYLLAGIRSLRSWNPGMLEVDAGSGKVSCHSVVVCNAARYGGSFILAPDAGLFSPDFRVVCFPGPGRWPLAAAVLRIIAGLGGGRGRILDIPAPEVIISGRKEVQLDGDFYGYSPVTVRAVENFARLVI